MSESVHPIDPAFRRLIGLFGLVFVVAMILVAWLIVYEKDKPPQVQWMLMLCAGGAFFAALWCLWVYRRAGLFTVVISAEGIRVGPGRQILWKEIRELRQRKFLKRTELIGEAGKTLAAIEDQVQGAQEVTARIREAIAQPPVADSSPLPVAE